MKARIRHLAVPCPYCGSAAGERCIDMRMRWRRPLKRAHESRVRFAKAHCPNCGSTPCRRTHLARCTHCGGCVQPTDVICIRCALKARYGN